MNVTVDYLTVSLHTSAMSTETSHGFRAMKKFSFTIKKSTSATSTADLCLNQHGWLNIKVNFAA